MIAPVLLGALAAGLTAFAVAQACTVILTVAIEAGARGKAVKWGFSNSILFATFAGAAWGAFAAVV